MARMSAYRLGPRLGVLQCVVIIAALVCGGSTHAGSPSVTECFEGSDFIANAARARDNGIARTVFLARMDEEFVMTRAFPPALRWFAKDFDDEQFLRAAAITVFDAPAPPEHHRALFLDACFARSIA